MQGDLEHVPLVLAPWPMTTACLRSLVVLWGPLHVEFCGTDTPAPQLAARHGGLRGPSVARPGSTDTGN